jgi:protein-L-isoaspartate(D-aspartate) O-methyltransferase
MSDAPDAAAQMVAEQIAGRGVRNPRVLAALAAVPRDRFVDPELAARAYADTPLPIGGGQTISQPLVVALMAAAAEIGPDDRVLEVGAGSGYAAAVFGRLAARVDAVERLPALAAAAAARLAALGIANVHVHCGDGTRGWPDQAPYDAILVAAAAPAVPDALMAELAPGGRLVMPVGGGDAQRLIRRRRDGARVTEEDLGPVRFVPLIADA